MEPITVYKPVNYRTGIKLYTGVQYSFVQPITAHVFTPSELEERGAKIAGEAWDAAQNRYDFEHFPEGWETTPPDKEQYLNSLK